MTRTVAEKMGVRVGARAYLEDVPPQTLAALALPDLAVPTSPRGELDHLHLFARTRAQLDERFPVLRDHLAPQGAWVSWPKGRRLSTDLTLPVVIEVGYAHGLVESETIGVDATWSAIKFTYPVPGRTYANSYGRLPS